MYLLCIVCHSAPRCPLLLTSWCARKQLRADAAAHEPGRPGEGGGRVRAHSPPRCAGCTHAAALLNGGAKIAVKRVRQQTDPLAGTITYRPCSSWRLQCAGTLRWRRIDRLLLVVGGVGLVVGAICSQVRSVLQTQGLFDIFPGAACSRHRWVLACSRCNGGSLPS